MAIPSPLAPKEVPNTSHLNANGQPVINPGGNPIIPAPTPSPLVGNLMNAPGAPRTMPSPLAPQLPAVTAASAGPSDQYAQYQKAINEIIYSKGRYAEGKTNGNDVLAQWAANNAKQYYDQLPPELSAKIHAMGLDDSKAFYASLFGGGVKNPDPNLSVPTDQSATVNPYDAKVNDLLTQLQNKIDNPEVNPWDAKLGTLIDELQKLMDAPVENAATSAAGIAAQARVDKQAQQSVRDAQESLGGSGLARSSIVSDRAQGISDDAKVYLETQVLPVIQQQLQAEKQAKIDAKTNLIGIEGQQQELYDTRGQLKIENLNKLLSGEVSQQELFETKKQNDITNTRADKQLKLEQDKFSFDKAQTAIDNAHKDFNDAVQRLNQLGYVTGADAKILGVKAGTTSWQAQDAIAQRKFQFETQARNIAAESTNLDKQIAATARNTDKQIAATAANVAAQLKDSQLNRAESKQARLDAQGQAKISDLMRIYETTRIAPPGLEAYGIVKGTKLEDSPSVQLDRIKLDQAISDSEKQKLDEAQAPLFQASYGVDQNTAIAMLHTINNPSRESALADLNANAKNLVTLGVDPAKIMLAVDDKWPVFTPQKAPKTPASVALSVKDDVADHLKGGLLDPATYGIDAAALSKKLYGDPNATPKPKATPKPTPKATSKPAPKPTVNPKATAKPSSSGANINTKILTPAELKKIEDDKKKKKKK